MLSHSKNVMVNPCSLCTALCCKKYLITVTSFDVLRIVQKSGRKAGEFARLSDPKILNRDNDAVLECYEGKERYDYLLTLKSRPCIFLGTDNRCSIHAFAPWVCTLYPHRSDDGKVTARALCPSLARLMFMVKKPDVAVEAYQQQMQAYKKIVKRWNRLRGAKEDCISYLLKESRKETKKEGL